MNIDRSLFLVLTGTIAAGTACIVVEDKPAQTPPQTATGPTPPPPATAAPTTAPTAKAAPAPTQPTHIIPFHLHPQAGGNTPAPATSDGGAAPPPPATGDAGGAPQACLNNDSVPAGDCSKLQAVDSSCAPFPFPASKCAAYGTYFDPKVAAAAVQCMQGLSGKQLCDATQTYTCGNNALKQACPDTNVAQLCAVAATSCKTTAQDCTAQLSGLNDAGRQAVAKCVAQGCNGGLYSCIEGLTSSSEGSTKSGH